MSRHHFTFPCGDERLAATMDMAPGSSGLLMITGGNEVRSGAFSGQAQLAARISEAGFPVFRFDRRGVGDSTGENRGFRKSGPDIATALSAFQAMAPQMDHVTGFGNCDGASALMLGGGYGCDALVLSNPWTIENDDAASIPASSIRSRYAEKLKNPRELARLLTGGVNLRKLAGGLASAIKPKAALTTLAQDMQRGLLSFPGPARILIAERDRTAAAFIENWAADDTRIEKCAGATHAYVEETSAQWLEDQLLKALRR